MHPRLGDTDFLKATWLISGRARIRTQGGMTANFELLTSSSTGSLFHLSGKLGFIIFFFSSLTPLSSGPTLFSRRLFPHGSRDGPGSSGLVGLLVHRLLRSRLGVIMVRSCKVVTDNAPFCVTMPLLSQGVESLSFPPESEMVFLNQDTVTEVTFWDF